MLKVIVFGIRQIADVAHFYLTHDSPYEVAAFTVDREFCIADQHLGLPVVPFEVLEETYPPSEFAMFIAMSYKSANRARTQKYQQAKDKGYTLVSYVSSKALVWPGLVCGDNCFILENNVIQPFVQIGNNVTLWSGNHIGHHSAVGDNCFVSSHVVVSGNVTIESNCFLGVNATLRDGITIAQDCVVGAGALILRSTKPNSVYVGNSARLLPMASDELPELL
jgi:sugar O-acyltransferase (sialic acid O-acetyltransferase NeuD family)